MADDPEAGTGPDDGWDLERPNIARMYDYVLGGSSNTAVDRTAAEDFLRVFPRHADYARANRGFLVRAVRTLVTEYGVNQFLDLGSGIPTVGNVHEIAQEADPHARVAYVEWESVAVAYARRMLAANPRASVTQADVRDPQAVLTAPEVTGLLDFDRPVAVLACGILDLLPHDDAAAADLVATYRQGCCTGSALVLSHSAQFDMTDDEVAAAREVMRRTPTPDLWERDRDAITALLPGYELLTPGVVSTAAWRPHTAVSDDETNRANAYAAVGLLPS